MSESAQAKGGIVPLSDEPEALEILRQSVLGLWDTVNNLTRLRPTKRDRYRVTFFGSARVDPNHWVYAAVRDAADPERVPGFMMVLGPGGPVGFSANVSIREEDDPLSGRPRRIAVEGSGEEIELRMTIEVDDAAVRTRVGDGPSAVDFLQMRGTYRVTGRAAGREIDFTAGGAAETFRGGPGGAATAPRPARSDSPSRRDT